MFTPTTPIIGLLYHFQHGGMVIVSIWQVFSSSLAQILQELVGDIRDITQVFTWDLGGALTWVIMD